MNFDFAARVSRMLQLIGFRSTRTPVRFARLMTATVLGLLAAGSASAGVTPQTISYSPSLGAALFVGGSRDLLGTASSGLPVTYTTSGACTVSSTGTLTAISSGNCGLSLSQAGDATYAPASASFNISVSQISQTISYSPSLTAELFVGGARNIGASASSGLPVTYTTSAACTASSTGLLTAISSGTCGLTLSQAGNTTYAPASASFNISVSQVAQTINYSTSLTAALVVGNTRDLGATASSGLPVTYATSAACTVSSSGILTAVSSGTCSLTLSQSGNVTYAPTSQSLNLSIGQGSQSISYNSAWTRTIPIGGTTNPGASASSGLPLTYTASPTGICMVSSTGVVTGISGGTCGVSIAQAGDASYAAASQVALNVTVLYSQAIVNFSSNPGSLVRPPSAPPNPSTGTFSAVGGASGNAVTYTNLTPDICSVSGNNVSALMFGTCKIAADQAGNASYSAAPQVILIIPIGAPEIGPTTQPTTVLLDLIQGWNLAGNSSSNALDVASAFGDTKKVSTVWKWIAGSAKWAFYAPSLTAQALADYAAGKGYDILTTINSGEGFWVNAKTIFTATMPTGVPLSSASFQGVASGWNLLAVGDNNTPRGFNNALSATPPAVDAIPTNITSLWAWDAAQSNWYFYAPSLDQSGGLSAYVTSKGYLDFGASKTIVPAMGFWVNKPTP